jgi:hypothetical protein
VYSQDALNKATITALHIIARSHAVSRLATNEVESRKINYELIKIMKQKYILVTMQGNINKEVGRHVTLNKINFRIKFVFFKNKESRLKVEKLAH